MTEREWLEGTDAERMLNFLCGKVSERKLRLFGCACCRYLWGPDVDERVTAAVGVAERYADGAAPAEEADHVVEVMGGLTVGAANGTAKNATGSAAWAASSNDDITFAMMPARIATYDHGDAALSHEVVLLRDVVGNPFRPSHCNPAWLTPTVVSLATAAYDERHLPSGHLDIERLAVLSDALEEAGCSEPEILKHLRSGGPHVRGCWALDLLLNKV